MLFEIVIEGTREGIMALARDSAPAPASAPQPVPRWQDGQPEPSWQLRLEVPEESALDGTLTRLSIILDRLEKTLPELPRFELRVRNLAYAEPAPEPSSTAYRPVSGLWIQPWDGRSTPREPAPDTILLHLEHAFGSGTHPSSRLCLGLLRDLFQGRLSWGPARGTVLDFGCGTGLLALAAVQWGAARAVAVEIDPLAAETARRNVRLNRLEQRIEVRQGSTDALDGRYDLILANLVPAALLQTFDALWRHLRVPGHLIVAGFGGSRAAEFGDLFSERGLRIAAQREEQGWAALLLEKVC